MIRGSVPSIAILLAYLLFCQSVAWPWQAQAPRLHIVVLEGDEAINNIRQRVTREAVVRVEDENNKPVAGAAVVFFLPGSGPSGVFANGATSLTTVTDEKGVAIARGLRPNNVAGKFQMRVSASHQGQTTSTNINQTNVSAAAAAGGISAKLIAILLVAGGAAAGGIVAATRGGGAAAAAPPAPTTITPGAPSVGGPR